MRATIYLTIGLLSMSAAAQDLITTPGVITAPESSQTAKPELSPGETRIRAGIVLLGLLLDAMSKVQDHDTAEAAVPTVMKISRELPTWGQGFTSLAPLDEATQSEYEKKYLPIINKLNERIQIQADRIAAAEFYGSENLPAAFIKLVQSVQ